MRLPLLSQASLLLIGLIVPIGVPAVMGLEYYGHFVTVTASAFLVQRLADFPAETLIFAEAPRALLGRATALQSAFFTLAALSNAFGYSVDLVFLLSLQVSSVAFAMVLACRNDRLTFAYLGSFLAAYLAALAAAFLTGRSLVDAISVPNFLAGLWIPAVLSLRPAQAQQGSRPDVRKKPLLLDIPVRVAAGSFVAFATLGLAALSTTKASDAAQVRLLGTALGMAAFMLPWPMKSLVGVLRAAEPLVLGRLQRYLVGAGLLCVSLMAAAGTTTEANPLLLCAGMALLFLNFQVVERWNVADGRLGLQACIALLATVAALFAYRIDPVGLPELPRSAFAILLGCAVYGILSQRLLPSRSNGRGAALGLWSFSVAAAVALTWSQR